MAYHELIKNFGSIRDYMRQFYVYGFKRRGEYDAKSARSYDNERRRIESWMGEYMSFGRTADGKNVFLSLDSRDVPANPLYNAFRAKSFTAGDITLHFYLLDILGGGACTVNEIVERISRDYLSQFEGAREMDVSSVRKKLKEYEALGLVKSEKRGRALVYSLNESRVDLAAWRDAAAFFSEAEPLGVIGATLLDRLPQTPDLFRFKHHYMLDALNAEIIAALAGAIHQNRCADITVRGRRTKEERKLRVFPLKLYISTQTGRQYLLSYSYRLKKPDFFRLDNIRRAVAGPVEPKAEKYQTQYRRFAKNLWGVSIGEPFTMDHVELVLRFESWEKHIPARLEREKRCGVVERLDGHTCRFTADVYDAAEMLPWVRTFIGRVVRFTCSNEAVERAFTRIWMRWRPCTEVTAMLFHEVYGSYYAAVAEILRLAASRRLTREKLYAIVRVKGFSESGLTIPRSLTDGTWPLLRPDLTTPLHSAPAMPLTALQKRWLKTLLSDPRIGLFGINEQGLEDVEPLYGEDIFVYYDRYADGDPYSDPDYIAHFRTILTALHGQKRLRVAFKGRLGKSHCRDGVPIRLEYSSKDDKFRLLLSAPRDPLTVNLARIEACTLLEEYAPDAPPPERVDRRTAVLELTDKRNALERVMLHFSHFEKETVRLTRDTYRLTLHYRQDDETELLIRVLAFGPLVRVVSPDDLIQKIRERLIKQQKLRT